MDRDLAAWCRRQLGAEPEAAPLGRLAATADRDGDLDDHPGPAWLDRLALEVGERAARAGLEVAGGA